MVVFRSSSFRRAFETNKAPLEILKYVFFIFQRPWSSLKNYKNWGSTFFLSRGRLESSVKVPGCYDYYRFTKVIVWIWFRSHTNTTEPSNNYSRGISGRRVQFENRCHFIILTRINIYVYISKRETCDDDDNNIALFAQYVFARRLRLSPLPAVIAAVTADFFSRHGFRNASTDLYTLINEIPECTLYSLRVCVEGKINCTHYVRRAYLKITKTSPLVSHI